ncbi:cellulase family glycosylhydrolase [Solwaraspora sp. WMMB335]|uniref:cellulase family glycosylhydrolase n=1 Tax=Solwaraspora sp. WMMB335 TaxID=3404118 RepID=UPI003B95EDA9
MCWLRPSRETTVRRWRFVVAGGAAALVVAAVALLAPAASAATAAFVKVSDWGSGYEGRFTVTNDTASTITAWRVAFDLPSGTGIGSAWNARMSAAGNRYTFDNASWNGTIAAGASTTFGFIVTGRGTPANCAVNGGPCAGGPAPTSAPPTVTPPTTAPPTTPPPTTPPPSGGSPVQINGQLRVCGTDLCNQHGNPIQLRGMSSHGLQWYAQCVNDASLDALATDWRADVLRISMYIQEDGYETDPRGFTDRVHDLIEKASARGMYAIVDWHMLTPGDPNYNVDRARTFFAEIARRHAAKPNVLYEIANEPNGVSWAAIKGYAEQVIPVIRAADPDGIVLVGTRAWSSLGVSEGGNESEVISNPITAPNVMYTFHFYAGSHHDSYRAALSRAADRLPMFVTEFGTQTYTGDGANDFTSAQQWIDLLASRKVSWINWNFSDDFRSGAVFRTGVCAGDSYAGSAVLKEAGVWIRDRIRTADDFPTS